MSDINPTGSSPEDASFSFNRLPGPDGLRRSSSRSIKRKKFDDEVVDTSNPFKRMPSSRRSSESSQPDQKPSPLAKKPQPVPSDFGRWRPTDDLALITAVQQTNDLNAVHLGVKFSCHFTLREVQERWYALLYDPVVSKLSQQAMKQLPTDVIQGIQSSALWSKEEELVLVDIASNSNPNLQRFENLFEENQSIFHKSRTAKALLNHWLLMKHYQLLSDQSARSSETDVNLHDMESRLNDDEILESKDEMLDQELFSVDRRQKRELKRLEEEIPQWQVIVDEMIGSGSSVSEFDSQTLAVLRGRVVRYLMRSKEITFGRNTSDTRVDIDFSLEGPTWKISRRHGMIKMTNDGKFMLHNQGRRPVFINGAPVVAGSSIQLPHNSALEICGLKFLFLINPDLKRVKEAKQESLLRKERAAEGNTT
ncbi:microspherule protein 1-like isoform X3 [Rhopilema esculentum]|uniref:microspherule protein 1-like isoform X3 n=1 Tax=Rhopilema esculentum TaxID=499914 RepID=UPI0031DCE6D7|eukprot:gene13777-4705_t